MKTIQMQIFFGVFLITGSINFYLNDVHIIEKIFGILFYFAFMYFSFITPKDK